MAPSLQRTKYLDRHLRLRLSDLDSKRFEDFFLHFLNAGVSLTIKRGGKRITRRVISAVTYAAGTGKSQKGIDLRVEVEGNESWCFQCKRHKSWNVSQTRTAMKAAEAYKASHYFLAVACDPSAEVHDEVTKHPKWELWNLDRICEVFRLNVSPHRQAKIVSFLDPSELKRFVPFQTQAVVTADEFFEPFLSDQNLFRHDWALVGRDTELERITRFLESDDERVLIIVSKGGDGKTRLLFEVAQKIAASTDAEAFFLNPHSRDDPELAFLGDAAKPVLIVDDAHRDERIPVSLLAAARQHTHAKVIFATRPQGLQTLSAKLFEAGIAAAPTVVPLRTLTKAQLRALASEALGEALTEHAAALADLATGSPFLVVLGGRLLATRKLAWGDWSTDQEFRSHVFRSFEQENLRGFSPENRSVASGLLRVFAMVSPSPLSADLIQRTARCLSSNDFAIETLVRQLRNAEVITGNDAALRIVPDLFADFLVYDACFEPRSKLPTLCKRITEEFTHASAAILRNVAEASWVAQTNGILDEAFLRPVIDAELNRFRESSFYARANSLRHWAAFCAYVPSETLELARLAVSLNEAPPDESLSRWSGTADRLDSHAYVKEQATAILETLARYHDRYRADALDILWDLGPELPWSRFQNNQAHPWSRISGVIKFERAKPVSVSMSALSWLERKLEDTGSLDLVARDPEVLTLLLRPCFDRLVHCSEWEGLTVRFWEQPVSIERTQTIRDKAIAILQSVVSRGACGAAVSVLHVTETIVQRVAPLQADKVARPAKFRQAWRPEREKGLALCRQVLQRFNEVAVRYSARQILKRNLMHEEDSVFAASCRKVLKSIREDLPLRLALATFSQGVFEVEDFAANKEGRSERTRNAWQARVQQIAVELLARYRTAKDICAALTAQAEAFQVVDRSPHYRLLFTAFVNTDAKRAYELAEEIVSRDLATGPGNEWPSLLREKSFRVTAAYRRLLARAAASSSGAIRTALIIWLDWRSNKMGGLEPDERSSLLTLAKNPTYNEAFRLLKFVEGADGRTTSFAFRLLRKLNFDSLADRLVGEVLEALFPYGGRTEEPPKSLIRHVLNRLVTVNRIDLNQHHREWTALCTRHALLVFNFLSKRIQFAQSEQRPRDYAPLPKGYRVSWDLTALKKSRTYVRICDELWSQVGRSNSAGFLDWLALFQAVTLDDESYWVPRMLKRIEKAATVEELRRMIKIIKFDGSVIVFRCPDITRSFLRRAEELAGISGRDRVRSALYVASGPEGRSYVGAELDAECDYVEGEAAKAAESFKDDPVLRPFFEWVVAVEQRDRIDMRARHQAEMAELQ